MWDNVTDPLLILENTERSQTFVNFWTFAQSDEKTWPNQQKDNDKDNDKDKDKDKDNENDKYI